MRCSYTGCAVNHSGDRIEGAEIYLVPYVEPINTSVINAVALYSSRSGGTSFTSKLTGTDGNAFFWVDEGEYTVITQKDGQMSVVEHEAIFCSQSAESETVTIKNVSIGDSQSSVFEIPCDGEILHIEVTDAAGNLFYPSCSFEAGVLTLSYAEDCKPDTHNVAITLGSTDEFEVPSEFPSIKLNGALLKPDSSNCINLTFDNNGVPQSAIDDLQGQINNIDTGTVTQSQINTLQEQIDALNANDLPTFSVNGNALSLDADNNLNIQILDGGSNLISTASGVVTVGAVRDCEGAVINTQTAMFEKCELEQRCGFIGSAICETPALGNVVINGDQVSVPYAYASGLTGSVVLTKQSTGGSFTVSNQRVESQFVAFDVQLTGDVRVLYNVAADKQNLPDANDCLAPLESILRIDGFSGAADGSRIEKSVGGSSEFTNMQDILENVFETINNAESTYTDTVAVSNFGGSSVVGATHVGSLEVFDQSEQTITIRVQTCHYVAVQAIFESTGVFDSAIDSNGQAVLESEFRSL